MILYAINKGVITVKSVKKETPTGWREHNNGFTNRNTMGKFVNVTETYYTTSLSEAKDWATMQRSEMHFYLQVAKTSDSEIDLWEEEGMHEEDIPEPRNLYFKER